VTEHVFPGLSDKANREKWLWRSVWLLGCSVSLYLALELGIEWMSGVVGASVGLLLASFFRKDGPQRDELIIDTESGYIRCGPRYYPVASIREVTVVRFSDGTAALRFKAERMRELRVPARLNVDSAVDVIQGMNPSIRVIERKAVLASRLGRWFRKSPNARS